MIGSAEVNKVIRRVLSPTLRDREFTKVQTRNNWRHLNDLIWVFVIRAIGHTGLPDYFPTQSLHCEIEFRHSSESEVTVTEGGRTATLSGMSKSAQFRKGEEVDWLDWTSQSRAATMRTYSIDDFH